MANKQYNMATSPSVGTGGWTYAGELALPYIHASVISAPTLHGGNVTLLDGIRYKAIIPVMANADLIETASCDFQTTATTSLTEAVLDVTDLMVNLQLCKNTFNVSDTTALTGQAWWQGDAYSLEQGVPDDYADALLLYVAKSVQASIEHNIWQGNANGETTYTSFNGFRYLVAGSADASGNTLPASHGLDGADVLAGLRHIVANMPSGLIGDFENVSLYVSPATISAYNIAIGQTGNGYNDATANGGQTNFVGYKLVSCSGMASGHCLVASKRNLFVGIGTADSDSLAQAIDMTPLDGSNNYRVTMRFAVGCQVGVNASTDVKWFLPPA